MLSIMGGLSISIGFLCYINCPNIFGACLFSIGLYLVLWNDFYLFTGKIGYCKTAKDFLQCLFIFIGNGIGCCLSLIQEIPEEMVENKFSQPLGIIFVKGAICGVLIFTAADLYKKGKVFAPALAVPAFIMSGAEHCIADICFMISARTFNVLGLLVVIMGNSFGSLFMKKLTHTKIMI